MSKRFDTVPFCCVINKCQTRTSDKLKSVCIVLCCCVQYVEIFTEQEAFADALIFCFHLKKTAVK